MTASNEATLERMLQKIVDVWGSTDLRLVAHVSAGVSIIAGAEDIVAQLEESQVTINTIKGSKYVAPIKVSFVEYWLSEEQSPVILLISYECFTGQSRRLGEEAGHV